MKRGRETAVSPSPGNGSVSYRGLILAAFGSFVATVGCVEESDEIRVRGNGGEGVHLLSIQDTSTASLPPPVASLADGLKTPRVAWSVGTLDGPPETRWGLPADAEVDGQGRIFVLDRQNVEVRVFRASDGQFLGRFLRDGSGPLEMRDPRGIELLRGDSLLVYSASEVRITSTDPLDAVHEVRRFTYSGNIWDLCAGGSGLYARLFSGRSEGPLERLDRFGEPQARFGHVYDHEDPAVRAQLSMGMLDCSPTDHPTVVTATIDGPRIRTYSSEGDSIWTAEVGEFKPRVIQTVDVQARTGIRRPGEEPYDRVLTLVEVTPEAVLAQVARVGAARVERGTRRSPIERKDSFLLSTQTGEGLFLGSHLPHLLHATEKLGIGVRADQNTGLLKLIALRW